MTANWFADGQHVLALAGGSVAVGLQVVNLWRTARNGAAIKIVHRLVANGDETIAKELANASASIGKLQGMLADRRKPGSGSTTWAGVERRGDKRDDPPKT